MTKKMLTSQKFETSLGIAITAASLPETRRRGKTGVLLFKLISEMNMFSNTFAIPTFVMLTPTTNGWYLFNAD